MMARAIFILAFVLQLAGAAGARADSSAGSGKTYFNPDTVAGFSKVVERELAKRGARVVILARQGRPAHDLPEGVGFTHTGFAVYSTILLADGTQVPGYAIYNLYRDADDLHHSRLVSDYPADFFRNVAVLRAGVIVPSPTIQRMLLEFINTDSYRKVHNPRYSLMSSPSDGTSQNCTEFVLDVINAVVYNTTDRAQLKQDAKQYFTPQPISTNRVLLGLAAIVRPEIELGDHQGAAATATFETIAAYLSKFAMSSASFVVTAAGVIEESRTGL